MVSVRDRPRRKRHVQQALFRRGGKRKGAGRKPLHGRAGTPHRTRDEIDGRDALHVVLRTVAEIGNLRRREIYHAVRAASATAARSDARRAAFRITQLSIQHDHLHLLVEAESAEALALGMQGFLISAARRVNTALRVGGRRRRGAVFADRYHVVVIRSPRQARHVLAYIMCNWRKHGEDRFGLPSTWLVDPFSSARVIRWLEGAPGPAAVDDPARLPPHGGHSTAELVTLRRLEAPRRDQRARGARSAGTRRSFSIDAAKAYAAGPPDAMMGAERSDAIEARASAR
jgi:REP element-mobilizing transposase RayT